MSSKIRVDPRTFKIINQAQSKAQPQSQSQSQTTTESFTSDQESSTSVNSDTESVKVIKLDSSEQSGGLAKSNGPSITGSEVRIQPSQDRIIKPAVPNPQQAPAPAPASAPAKPPVLAQNNNNNLSNYLSINNNQNSEVTEITEETNTSGIDEATKSEGEQEETLESAASTPPKEDTTQDVFDLTQNKLYQVLSKFFEAVNGDGIGVNLDKMSKLFEAHNQIMEKMLNQLIIMNSNYKQVKVPQVVLSSTKQAGNVTDFRKNLDALDSKDPKKH